MCYECTKKLNNIRQAQLFFIIARLHVWAFLIGNHRALLHYELVNAMYILGSQYTHSIY
jgi:hypothetical protein